VAPCFSTSPGTMSGVPQKNVQNLRRFEAQHKVQGDMRKRSMIQKMAPYIFYMNDFYSENEKQK
jgi:hypothetical protein